MKKILTVFIFIFLAGLFSGVFYSTGLSAENTDRLSEIAKRRKGLLIWKTRKNAYMMRLIN